MKGNNKSNKFLVYWLSLYIASVLFIAYLPYGANVSQIIGFSLAFFFFSSLLLKRKKFVITKEIIIFTIFFIYSLLGSLWALDPNRFWESELTLFQLIILLILIINIINSQWAFEFVSRTFVWSLAIISLIGVVDINKVVKEGKRWAATLANPNLFGLVLLFATVVVLYLIYRSDHVTKKILYIGFILLYIANLVLTGSRKAVTGMLLLPIIYLIFISFGKFKNIKRKVALAILLILSSGGVIWGVQHTPFSKRIERFYEYFLHKGHGITAREAGIGDRIYLYREAWRIFKKHPFLGVGTNQYRFHSLIGKYAHSNFLEILVDFGIVGFLIYYYVYFSIFSKFLRLSRNLPLSKKEELSFFFILFFIFTITEIGWVSYLEKISWIIIGMVLSFLRIIELQNQYSEI